MLLLDLNEDRFLQVPAKEKITVKSTNKTMNFDAAVKTVQNLQAKVQINTLSPYVSFGGGIYKMSDVKRMTAKEDFLKMPWKDRKCEVESYEDCRTRKLFEYCKCIPWEHFKFQVVNL